MKEKILEILNDINDEIDYESCTTLIDDEYFDSFDIVALVGALNDEFDIRINVVNLVPDNFNSVDAIVSLVDSLING